MGIEDVASLGAAAEDVALRSFCQDCSLQSSRASNDPAHPTCESTETRTAPPGERRIGACVSHRPSGVASAPEPTRRRPTSRVVADEPLHRLGDTRDHTGRPARVGEARLTGFPRVQWRIAGILLSVHTSPIGHCHWVWREKARTGRQRLDHQSPGSAFALPCLTTIDARSGSIPFPEVSVGVDDDGRSVDVALSRCGDLLIVGPTGSGKSVDAVVDWTLASHEFETEKAGSGPCWGRLHDLDFRPLMAGAGFAPVTFGL